MHMSDALIRLGILILVILSIVALVQLGRLFIARQRKLALAAAPLSDSLDENIVLSQGKVHILAFSSADCTQCHTLQQPALRRLQTLRREEIDVVEIDAPSSPALAKRYRILTVPSTVVLNTAGEAYAVNYGFANFAKLKQQIDAVLTAS
ncbi:MAG TPA: thioredoxin family protein [Ktedonobacteraceae bacterium]|jgi:thioredoxin-like negative regulator of GroEL|nr:thioredoxin family protein [Ktedonobacteraceae bacterium]